MTDLSPFHRPEPRSPRRGALAKEVVAYICELVLSGALKPGTKIYQEAVSGALAVSRSQIREALVIQGHEGLFDVTPRQGAAVAQLTPEDFVDHFGLFGVVSGQAAAMAAELLKGGEIDQLAALRAHRFWDQPAAGGVRQE